MLNQNSVAVTGLKRLIETVYALDIHALVKKRYVRPNQGLFMNRILQQKEIMKRSRLRNNSSKNNTEDNQRT